MNQGEARTTPATDHVMHEVTQAVRGGDGAVEIEGGNDVVGLHRLVSDHQRRSQPRAIGHARSLRYTMIADRVTALPARCQSGAISA
jgi:phage protein U